MRSYLAGQIVLSTIALVDDAGQVIVATGVSYRVLNETGTVLVGATAVSPWTAGTDSVGITVAAPTNVLPGGVVRALRTIELTLTTDEGTRILLDNYLIEALEPLVVPTNSFQTLGAAELIAAELPRLNGWSTASRGSKIAALIQARLNIAELPYRYTFSEWQSHLEPEFGLSDIKLLSQTEFAALSVEFTAALVRAQVFEADDILGGNPYADKRKAGIVSETIGESSVTFERAAVKLPLCERATRVLSKYIVKRVRVGRA